MSSALKWLSGFCGSGLVATCPLTLANQNKQKEELKKVEEIAPPRIEVEVIPPPVNPIKQIIEEGYKGCSILPDSHGRTLLYVCLKKDGSLNPSFFYYDRSKTIPQGEKRIKQIDYITGGNKQYPRFAVMNFVEGGGSLPLKFAPPIWIWKWKGLQVKPERDCLITDDTENSRHYSNLTCKTTKTGTPDWSQKIQSIT